MGDDIQKTAVELRIADTLTARVLRDALMLARYAIRDDARIVLTDEPVPSAIMEGRTIVSVRADAEDGRIRLGAVLARLARHDAGAATGILAFGGFRLDMAQLILRNIETKVEVNLTEKERDILARLHREGGRALDRRTLLEDVWGYAAAVETHTLETHIYRLRQKLEIDPARPEILVTDEAGYRLDGVET